MITYDRCAELIGQNITHVGEFNLKLVTAIMQTAEEIIPKSEANIKRVYYGRMVIVV